MYLEEKDDSNRLEIAQRVHDLGADLQRLLREVEADVNRARHEHTDSGAQGRKLVQQEQEPMDQSRDELPESADSKHAPTFKSGTFLQSGNNAANRTGAGASGTSASTGGPRETIYVYPNDELSMEEKRAQVYESQDENE